MHSPTQPAALSPASLGLRKRQEAERAVQPPEERSYRGKRWQSAKGLNNLWVPALSTAGTTCRAPALALHGRRRMDLTAVSLPTPRKKTALGSFSKAFLCYVHFQFFSVLKEPLCLSKFLSPRPAKWNKNTSTGSFSTTPTQPGCYPHCHTALQALQMKKQLESSWGRRARKKQ